MNEANTTALVSVRKSILVKAPRQHAFDVFTKGMSRWWLRTYSINKGSPIKDIVIEPHLSGRWYEVGEDGSVCDWGKVLAWEPAARLVLNWQITPQFKFDPNLVTELEIGFAQEGQGTRVSLEHRLDGYGAAAQSMRQIFDAPEGWKGLLESFAETI